MKLATYLSHRLFPTEYCMYGIINAFQTTDSTG